ncbi:pre-peptidase C-terminal domain-containing protein [Nostoc sp. FACHB-152]|uniref:PPC domain-containing protein n=1 Tax=unclassified Nostoc TaxID=2593658 RepID=UPI0016841F96|nr:MULTISPECIES: PPC domain-containing protein [unclassified Nostoc]MBD2452436.1 pre-peptidase C-terminal domain-containing protein [Nostoc sp. FACHB-152]MBD2472982.1 pre-peptidase C-terminal domain-containing protein [Nostoc sp. FACHB-145]
MVGQNNLKYSLKLQLALMCSVASSLAIAFPVLPISALEIPTLSKQFQIAKTPDERQPEAVQQGIEQIPAVEPPAPTTQRQPIDSPLPPRVPSTDNNTTTQPTQPSSTPQPSETVDTNPAPQPAPARTTPRQSNPTPQAAPVRTTPRKSNSTPQPAPPRQSNPTPQPAPARTTPRQSNPTPQPSQKPAVSPTLGRRQKPSSNRGIAAVSSGTPAYRKLNFVDIAFGILDKKDFQSQGRPYHFYQFEGRENQLVQLRLLGSTDQRRSNNLSLRPYMLLLDPNNNVILKRSGGETDRDAFIFARLPVEGTYTIAVTSQNPGDTGRYSLALRNDRASYILDESGQLTEQNSILKQNGSPYNVSPFQGTKNQLVSIRVDSINEEFSPYIVLLNSKGQRIAANSDRDGKYSALIDRARLPEDGVYYIVVTSSSSKQRGTYRLTLF